MAEKKERLEDTIELDPPVTLEMMLSSARRELALRHRAYPRMIQTGKLSRPIANGEIQRMAAICLHLREEIARRDDIQAEMPF